MIYAISNHFSFLLETTSKPQFKTPNLQLTKSIFRNKICFISTGTIFMLFKFPLLKRFKSFRVSFPILQIMYLNSPISLQIFNWFIVDFANLQISIYSVFIVKDLSEFEETMEIWDHLFARIIDFIIKFSGGCGGTCCPFTCHFTVKTVGFLFFWVRYMYLILTN